MEPELYTPTDVDAAYDAWGAACGPAALAALLRMQVNALRPYLGAKPWATPSDITRTLLALKRQYIARAREPGFAEYPPRGLAFVQFTGSWLKPGVPVGAAYKRTHWIACDRSSVYDVNAFGTGGWIPREVWVAAVVPALIRETRGADGYYFRTTIEVR